jgi:hypothetical protein
VIGPARFSSGRSSGEAPINWKIGFIAVCCRPKLYWIPKNPKFIRRICVKVNGGLRSRSTLCWASGCAAIAMREPPVYVSGLLVMVRLTRMSCDLRSLVGVRLTVGSCCHPIYELVHGIQSSAPKQRKNPSLVVPYTRSPRAVPSRQTPLVNGFTTVTADTSSVKRCHAAEEEAMCAGS